MYGPRDLRIKEVTLPEIKEDEVLIKLKACGICGSDVECFEGKSAEGRYDLGPYTPGHEWAGQVVQIGGKVGSVKVGDKVVGDCVLPCGKCANCKDGKMPSACLNMREVGFRPDSPGGFGEYLILEEKFTHVIPDDWNYELGAWVETFNVGYWGVWGNGCDPDASDDCAIIGGGPIGLTAAMTCKTSGAHVILIDPIRAKTPCITGRTTWSIRPSAMWRKRLRSLQKGAGLLWLSNVPETISVSPLCSILRAITAAWV